jgi:hypothetical protein
MVNRFMLVMEREYASCEVGTVSAVQRTTFPVHKKISHNMSTFVKTDKQSAVQPSERNLIKLRSQWGVYYLLSLIDWYVSRNKNALRKWSKFTFPVNWNVLNLSPWITRFFSNNFFLCRCAWQKIERFWFRDVTYISVILRFIRRISAPCLNFTGSLRHHEDCYLLVWQYVQSKQKLTDIS